MSRKPRCKKVKPISPFEVILLKEELFPDEIIKIINEMIAEKWDGTSAVIKQDDLTKEIIKKLKINKDIIFHKNYLEFEEIYEKKGWDVNYDKPERGESFDAYFRFSKKEQTMIEVKDKPKGCRRIKKGYCEEGDLLYNTKDNKLEKAKGLIGASITRCETCNPGYAVFRKIKITPEKILKGKIIDIIEKHTNTECQCNIVSDLMAVIDYKQ